MIICLLTEISYITIPAGESRHHFFHQEQSSDIVHLFPIRKEEEAGVPHAEQGCGGSLMRSGLGYICQYLKNQTHHKSLSLPGSSLSGTFGRRMLSMQFGHSFLPAFGSLFLLPLWNGQLADSQCSPCLFGSLSCAPTLLSIWATMPVICGCFWLRSTHATQESPFLLIISNSGESLLLICLLRKLSLDSSCDF